MLAFTLLLLALSALPAGCGNAGAPPPPPKGVVLIGSIRSFWTLEQLEAYLKQIGVRWTVRRPPPHDPSSWRPPFQVTTVYVERFSDLGFEGRLVIEFFNGRLVSTRFLPRRFDAYVRALRAKRGIRLPEKAEGEVVVGKYLRIWVIMKPQRFVGWEDLRLRREIEQWIKRYAKKTCLDLDNRVSA